MKLTVIIPLRVGCPPPPVLEDLRSLGGLEVILSYGRAAAQQRNHAAREARGEFLYFLDDDCRVQPQTLAQALRLLEESGADALGGPALTDPRAGFWERCFGECASSWFGVARLRARAVPVGRLRPTDGEELILCNLLIRAACFRAVQGLDERLYPGEDVDFWQRLRLAQARMLYAPELVVERGRRKTLGAFCLQYFRYGQGRGVRFGRPGRRPGDLLFWLPTLLAVYLAAGCPWTRLPLWTYTLLCLVDGLRIGGRAGLACALLLPCMHVSYGLGYALGLLGHGPPVYPGPPLLERVVCA